jgi:hypothetical protein
VVNALRDGLSHALDFFALAYGEDVIRDTSPTRSAFSGEAGGPPRTPESGFWSVTLIAQVSRVPRPGASPTCAAELVK